MMPRTTALIDTLNAHETNFKNDDLLLLSIVLQYQSKFVFPFHTRGFCTFGTLLCFCGDNGLEQLELSGLGRVR